MKWPRLTRNDSTTFWQRSSRHPDPNQSENPDSNPGSPLVEILALAEVCAVSAQSSCYCCSQLNTTRSVVAGFGRHGMPPPASNDWAKTAQTDHVTFDLGGHGACGWCGSSSSIRISSLKFVGLAVRNIWCTMCVSINEPGDLDLWPWNWYASRIKGREPLFQIWAR